MKKFFVIFTLLTITLSAQTYSFYASKVVTLDKTTNVSTTNYDGVTLDWDSNSGDEVTTLNISSGATLLLTPKGKNGSTFIFDGDLQNSTAGNAYVYFYWRNNKCYKITVEWTDLKFIYYIK